MHPAKRIDNCPECLRPAVRPHSWDLDRSLFTYACPDCAHRWRTGWEGDFTDAPGPRAGTTFAAEADGFLAELARRVEEVRP